MRKKLILLFSILFVLSTTLFVGNIFSFSAVALDSESVVVDFDGTSTPFTKMCVDSNETNFGVDYVQNRTTKSGYSLTVEEDEVDGKFLRLKGTNATSYGAVQFIFNNEFVAGNTYIISIEIRVQNGFTDFDKDTNNDANGDLRDGLFYRIGGRTSDVSLRSEVSDTFKVVKKSVVASSTTKELGLFVYTENNYFDIKNLTVQEVLIIENKPSYESFDLTKVAITDSQNGYDIGANNTDTQLTWTTDETKIGGGFSSLFSLYTSRQDFKVKEETVGDLDSRYLSLVSKGTGTISWRAYLHSALENSTTYYFRLKIRPNSQTISFTNSKFMFLRIANVSSTDVSLHKLFSESDNVTVNSTSKTIDFGENWREWKTISGSFTTSSSGTQNNIIFHTYLAESSGIEIKEFAIDFKEVVDPLEPEEILVDKAYFDVNENDYKIGFSNVSYEEDDSLLFNGVKSVEVSSQSEDGVYVNKENALLLEHMSDGNISLKMTFNDIIDFNYYYLVGINLKINNLSEKVLLNFVSSDGLILKSQEIEINEVNNFVSLQLDEISFLQNGGFIELVCTGIVGNAVEIKSITITKGDKVFIPVDSFCYYVEDTLYATSDNLNTLFDAVPYAKEGYEFIGWYNNTHGLFKESADLTNIEIYDGNFYASYVKLDMVKGASIFISDNNISGLQFRTKFDVVNMDVMQNLEFYTMIMPNDKLDEEFILDNYTIGEDLMNLRGRSIYESEDGSYTYFRGNIVNIRSYNYAREFSGRGYVTVKYNDASAKNIYADFNNIENTRSVYKVALAAFADRTNVELETYFNADDNGYYSRFTDEELLSIKKYIDGVVNLTLNDKIAVANPYYNKEGFNNYTAPYTVSIDMGGIVELMSVDSNWSFYTMSGAENDTKYYRASILVNGRRITPSTTIEGYSIPSSAINSIDEAFTLKMPIYSSINHGSSVQTSIVTGWQEYYNKTVVKNGVEYTYNGLMGFESSNSALCKAVNLGSTDLGIPIYDADRDVMYFMFGDGFNGHGHGSSSYWVKHEENRRWVNMPMAKMDDGFTFEEIEQNQDELIFDAFLTGTDDGSNGPNTLKDGHWFTKEQALAGETSQIASPAMRSTSGSKDTDKETSRISTGGIVLNGTIYIFFTSSGSLFDSVDVDESADDVANGGRHFSTCVKSTDGGLTWESVTDLTWTAYPSSSTTYVTAYENLTGLTAQEIDEHVAFHFTQMTPVQDYTGDYVYFYGQAQYGSDNVYMARVLKSRFEDFNAYEYFAGRDDSNNALWTSDPAQAEYIIGLKEDTAYGDGRCRNISVAYNAGLGKWMFVYYSAGSTSEQGDNAIHVRLADTIDGVYTYPLDDLIWFSKGNCYSKFLNWISSQESYTKDLIYTDENGVEYSMIGSYTEACGTNYIKGVNQFYGGYVSSKWISEDGKTFYFMMSQYNDCYNSSLVKVTLNVN